MVAARPLAGLLGILSSAWGLFMGLFLKEFVGTNIGGQPPPVPGSIEIILVSALLLITSLVCFVGFKLALYLSGVIAAVLIARVYISYATSSSGVSPFDFLVATALCVATIVLDILAARHKVAVSEENHPLNLPVFG